VGSGVGSGAGSCHSCWGSCCSCTAAVAVTLGVDATAVRFVLAGPRVRFAEGAEVAEIALPMVRGFLANGSVPTTASTGVALTGRVASAARPRLAKTPKIKQATPSSRAAVPTTTSRERAANSSGSPLACRLVGVRPCCIERKVPFLSARFRA
jgi:hypothetical protein